MPELPEVETAKRLMESVFKGKRIAATYPSRDKIVYRSLSAAKFSRALSGARVLRGARRGKYFWLELDRKPWPAFHLGMTGNLHRYRAGQEAPPRFCTLEIVSDDGWVIAFSDPRRFSRIWLTEDPAKDPAISKLGSDPLNHFISGKMLSEIFKKRRVAVKALLLDQSVFAGVGNWIADEVLFQSRIAPARLASDLSLAEIKKIRANLLRIIRQSVEWGANADRYPKSWLFHYRWGKGKTAQVVIHKRPEKIIHQTIGGRTTAWVPTVQK